MSPVSRLDAFLRERLHRLESQGVPEARLNLEHVLARHLGVPRLDLLLHREDVLPDPVCRATDADLDRLETGEPLQYILGDTLFHGLTIRTDRRALIPRPETEWVVDQVLNCPAIWCDPEPRLADVGTGTGCMALALAAARPNASVAAIDLEADALALARENRDRLGLSGRVELRLGNLLDGLPAGAFDAVVSNPPYIPTAVCGTLDRHVRDFEPRQALDGGRDGLSVIRRLAPQAWACLKPGRPLWLEIGFDQGPDVRDILAESGFERVEIRPDAAGHDRAACGWRRSG